MRYRSLTVEQLELPLVEPFETSFGVELRRQFLLVSVESSEGLAGWGECVATRDPLYNEESTASAWAFVQENVVPRWRRRPPTSVDRVRELMRPFRGNRMAKSAIEQAALDLEARASRRPLSSWLGGRRRRIEVGVSVGIQSTPTALARRVGAYLEEGYRRIKVKVMPGWDARPLAAVRRAYPAIELWVDANQGYPPTAVTSIRAWAERYEVRQVEQPFPERALAAHAALARHASFRVCLDESVVDADSLEGAIRLRAVQSLNVKAGRVGGPLEGIALARQATRSGAVAWVGGMLESGIGRAHSVALASHPVFSLPGDISASRRYYREEILERPFVLNADGTLDVPTGAGIGVELDRRAHRRAVRRRRTYALAP